jgi:eukaryotic-like serine/threonine-protein kinase
VCTHLPGQTRRSAPTFRNNEMTPARWQQVDRLLEAALELPAAERAAFLAQSCNGDEALRQEVLSLLAGSEQADDFFETPPLDDVAEVLRHKASAFAPGQQIGPYRILRELGRGGMGLVFLAVRADDAYQKQVAIKLVSPSPLQPELLRRFRRERQILADLEHPNIARLLDGGTTEQGWPYVVMEYVEGVPLTHYCRERQLALGERLRLFLDVCAAVQYAHQNLIIHRDLKPANILVTELGGVKRPKLLDFGIAKLLNPERQQLTAHETQSGVLMMTPEYASPEQMRGEALTTASDVYSLGVLLYELLTGHLPYQLKSRALPEIIRAVCETEPLAPSATIEKRQKDEGGRMKSKTALPHPSLFRLPPSALRGDLDNITLTALQKEPTHRYHTVQQLSEDIQRHLNGELVLARQATLSYRVQRFVKRNRAIVVTTALVLLTLLGGIVATLRQARVAQMQARANRRLAYAGQMHLAMQAWELANMGQLRELVAQSAPRPGEEDLRGFEWYYLWRLAHRNGERFSLPHPQEVWAVDLSPDGQRIASGCNDGKLRVWNTATRQPLGEYNGHTNHIWGVAWSPDGRQIATAGGDGTARLWEATTGRELAVFTGHQHKRVDAVAFSPDGKRLATGSRDGTARIWEIATGRELFTLPANASWVNTVAFSPDGRWLATGHAREPVLKLWDAATGREIRVIGTSRYWAIWSSAFSPDGKTIAVAGKTGIAYLLEVDTGKELISFKGHRHEIKSLAFSQDGKFLATASADRTIKLWDALTGAEITTLKGHTGQVWSVAFTPDGKSLVTSDTENLVKVWDLSATLEFTTRTSGLYAERIFAVFAPDGQKLAVGGDRHIDVVEAATGRVLTTCTGYDGTTSAVFSPDGKRLFAGCYDGTASIRDAVSGKELLTFKGHTATISSVALSPDGQTLATGSQDSRVKLWQATTGQELAALNVGNLVRAIAFSPDGKRLAAGGHDNAAQLWEVAARQKIAVLRGHAKPILALAFAPDGATLATGSADSTVKLWQVATGRELAVFKGPAGHVSCLSFSPDGRRLATGSSEGLVRLWDVATQQEVIALKVGDGAVRSVSFSPDGQTLVSSSTDPIVRVWRAATKQEVAAARGK